MAPLCLTLEHVDNPEHTEITKEADEEYNEIGNEEHNRP